MLGPGQKAPSTIRCIKTEHPFQVVVACVGQKAPSTIRCIKTHEIASAQDRSSKPGQKAPSTIRCIKTQDEFAVRRPLGSQKAPSTIRCIKTPLPPSSRSGRRLVRKHQAPKGALRHRLVRSRRHRLLRVRKQQALKGARRHFPRLVVRSDVRGVSESMERQEVHYYDMCTFHHADAWKSESTERQTVH